MSRSGKKEYILNSQHIGKYHLEPEMILRSVEFVHNTLDSLDMQLVSNGSERMAELIELANLSAMAGNLLRTGIAKFSDGVFEANGPHKYPDLISKDEGVADLEIKVALETNKPKGHLPKPGNHLICRYVLGDEKGNYTRGKENRGDVLWIWELRIGNLIEDHFNCSNTDGDSGKTAVINAAGMGELKTVYCDLSKCPYPENGKIYKQYESLLGSSLFTD